jgi:hypothetical protein
VINLHCNISISQRSALLLHDGCRMQDGQAQHSLVIRYFHISPTSIVSREYKTIPTHTSYDMVATHVYIEYQGPLGTPRYAKTPRITIFPKPTFTNHYNGPPNYKNSAINPRALPPRSKLHLE